jgi:hypothetical protein
VRYFHLGDVLSVATGRVLSRGYTKGFRAIVEHMGQQPCDHDSAFLAMYPECKLWLLQQYPQFGEVKMIIYLADLDKQLDQVPENSVDVKREIVFAWVDNLIFDFGERFLVNPIPEQHRPKIDVVIEAELLIGPGRVLSIHT